MRYYHLYCRQENLGIITNLSLKDWATFLGSNYIYIWSWDLNLSFWLQSPFSFHYTTLPLTQQSMLVYNPLWHQIPSKAYTSNAVKLLSPWSLLSSRMFSTPFRKTCWPIPPALFTYFYLQTFRQDTFSNQNALLLPLHETLSFELLLKIHLHDIFSNDIHPLSIIPENPCKSSHVKGPVPEKEEVRTQVKAPSLSKRT